MSKYYSLIREEMENVINKYSKEGAHDIYHLDRVYKMAKYINDKEKLNCDEDILCLASYMHDIHRLSFDGDNIKHSHDLGIVFYEICIKLDLQKDLIKKIKACIEATDKHNFNLENKKDENMSKESIVLQDADNLDALGTIGIGRAFMFGAYMQEKMYDPKFKLDEDEYDLTKKSKSIIHHFYEKLLKLELDMNTQTGKDIANKRTNYMEDYLNRFFEEFEVIV